MWDMLICIVLHSLLQSLLFLKDVFVFQNLDLYMFDLVYYELMCVHMKYSVYIYNSVHIINSYWCLDKMSLKHPYF